MSALETIGAVSIAVCSARAAYSIYIEIAQHFSTRRQKTKAGFDTECERIYRSIDLHGAAIGQGERRDFGALFVPFLLTFRPQRAILSPVARSDMDDLLQREFHIVAHKFYGRALDQSELHYLRSRLRRRALVLMATFCLELASRFCSLTYWKNLFSNKRAKPSSS